MTESRSGASRRGFLKGAAGGALATGALAAGGVPVLGLSSARAQTAAAGILPEMRLLRHPTIAAEPGSEAFWQEVRQAFPLPENYIHMNTGTTGSQPTFAQNNLAVYNHYKSANPRDWRENVIAEFSELFPTGEDVSTTIDNRQAAIAAMYGANEDEIVLSYNTTDACNMVFAGTPWTRGDRIVTTNLEHPAMLGPIRWARDYHGVEVVVVPVSKEFNDNAAMTVADAVAMFEPALAQPLSGGNKQYLAISEITYKNGLRLPIKELVAVARSHGAYSIIDSAHAWGMLPVNCHDYGADFIAGAGHKWLCGGPGTGIFYVRNHGENLPPFAMGNFYRYNENYENNRDWSPSDRMQARGEYNRPALYVMSETAAFWDHIGLQRIYDRGVMLSNYLKDKIIDKWGSEALWVKKSDEPAFATFLTAFNPLATKEDKAQFDAMKSAFEGVLDNLAAGDPQIYIRTVNWHDEPTIETVAPDDRIGFRVSTHAVYNDKAQIDIMFDRLVAEIDALDMPQLGS